MEQGTNNSNSDKKHNDQPTGDDNIDGNVSPPGDRLQPASQSYTHAYNGDAIDKRLRERRGDDGRAPSPRLAPHHSDHRQHHNQQAHAMSMEEGLQQHRRGDRDRHSPYPAPQQRQAHAHGHAHGYPLDNHNDNGNGRAMYSRQQQQHNPPLQQFEGEQEAYRTAQRKRTYNNDPSQHHNPSPAYQHQHHPPYHHHNNERRQPHEQPHQQRPRPQPRRYNTNCPNNNNNDNDNNGASAAGHAVLASIHAATKAFVLHPPTQIASRNNTNAGIHIGNGEKLIITLERSPDGTLTNSSIVQQQIQMNNTNNMDADADHNPEEEEEEENDDSSSLLPTSLASLERHAKLKHQTKLEKSRRRKKRRAASGAVNMNAAPMSGQKQCATTATTMTQQRALPPKPNDVAWEKNFHHLLLYQKKHNTWQIFNTKKSKYAEGNAGAAVGHTLCSWVKRQRYLYRNTFQGAARHANADDADADDTTTNTNPNTTTTTSPRSGDHRVNHTHTTTAKAVKFLLQDKYERLYNIGFPFPKMTVAEESESQQSQKLLTTSLKLFPPNNTSDSE
jgi:hypothetical protein